MRDSSLVFPGQYVSDRRQPGSLGVVLESEIYIGYPVALVIWLAVDCPVSLEPSSLLDVIEPTDLDLVTYKLLAEILGAWTLITKLLGKQEPDDFPDDLPALAVPYDFGWNPKPAPGYPRQPATIKPFPSPWANINPTALTVLRLTLYICGGHNA